MSGTGAGGTAPSSGDARQLDAAALAALEPEGRALLAVDGMWCASCASAVERVVARTPGILDARVSFDGASAVLRWDPARIDLAAVAERVSALGYRLARPAAADQVVAGIETALRGAGARLALGLFFGIWTMALSLVLYLDAGGVAGSPTGYVLAAVATTLAGSAVLAAGWPMLISGWRTLRAGVPGMDTLIALGSSAALALSLAQLLAGSDRVYADTAVMLMVLALVGRLVELSANRRAAVAIGALNAQIAEAAERRTANGDWERVPAAEVGVGALIRVPAGARVPLDGTVSAGASQLDRSLLTGESLPVEVGPGAVVEAGCINLRSPLALRVTAGVGARRVDQVGLRVAEALGAKSAAQRLADRVARVLVPAAIGLAVLTLAAGLAAGLDAAEAVLRAVSVLVIACPCAVSLAVPLTWIAAAQRGANSGVLFRTPRAIEGLAGVCAVLFDKTGTLSDGRPHVSAVMTAEGVAATQVLSWAARAEQGIEHPLAAALRDAAPEETWEQLGDDHGWQRERSGRFVRLFRAGEAPAPDPAEPPAGRPPAWGPAAGEPAAWGPAAELLVGSADALREQGISVPDDDRAETDGASRVEVACDGRWIGRILLRDRLRPDSAKALRMLTAEGLDLALVSGDRRGAVHAVAAQLGIAPRHVLAEASPEAKADYVAAQAQPVAFVGDGINDGVALARSAAGIAVTGASGSATAAADIVLAGPGLAAVATAYRIARRARGIMHQNLFLALVYNAGGLLLAAGGAVPPLAAALAMTASSVCVVANAARAALPPGRASRSARPARPAMAFH